MKTIYKYRLKLVDLQIIEMHVGAEILSAGLDVDSVLCVWTAQDTSQPTVSRRIAIVGTGNPLSDAMMFIGSVTQGSYVWHVFEACHG